VFGGGNATKVRDTATRVALIGIYGSLVQHSAGVALAIAYMEI